MSIMLNPFLKGMLRTPFLSYLSDEDSESDVSSVSTDSSDDDIEIVRQRIRVEEMEKLKVEEEVDRLSLNAIYEEKVNSFKSLLKDKGVVPGKSWTQVAPDLAVDERFNALSSLAERRATFDTYIRECLNIQNEQQKEAMKEQIEAFKTMIEELGNKMDAYITSDEFKALCKDDPRFNALPKKEADQLFYEKVDPLRKKVKRGLFFTPLSSLLTNRKGKGDTRVCGVVVRAEVECQDGLAWREITNREWPSLQPWQTRT